MSCVYVFLIIFVYFLFSSSRKSLKILKIFSFCFLLFFFLLTIHIWLIFDQIALSEQCFSFFFWIPIMNIFYILLIDNLSIFFLILTTFLMPLSILFCWNQFNFLFKEFLIIILSMQFLLVNFFLVTDLVFFYVCFEGILLPLFILIGVLGSRQRRIHASFQMFFYTLIGSFFMLFNIIFIFSQKGSTDFSIFLFASFPLKVQLLLWFFFFLSLSVKIPLFPFHIWLPEAHVEAPTVGSVILAGILLKLGTYGLLRFIIPVFPFANWYFGSFVQILCFLAIVYISLITLCQIDLKKLIAYSSVAHMGYATIALFAFNQEGFLSSSYLMLNHGIVSSLLFFLIGILYDRYKTRLFYYFQSLSKFMPVFSFFCFWAMLANIGFPGTSSFVAEFLVMISLISSNKLIAFYCGLGLIFSAFYSFWMYNRIFFGLNTSNLFAFSDISLRESFILSPFIVLIVFFGLFPFSLINCLQFGLESLNQNSFLNFFKY